MIGDRVEAVESILSMTDSVTVEELELLEDDQLMRMSMIVSREYSRFHDYVVGSYHSMAPDVG